LQNSAAVAVTRGGSTPHASDGKTKSLRIWEEEEALRGESDVFCRQILRGARFVQDEGIESSGHLFIGSLKKSSMVQ
jgi:hypothetical protein